MAVIRLDPNKTYYANYRVLEADGPTAVGIGVSDVSPPPRVTTISTDPNVSPDLSSFPKPSTPFRGKKVSIHKLYDENDSINVPMPLRARYTQHLFSPTRTGIAIEIDLRVYPIDRLIGTHEFSFVEIPGSGIFYPDLNNENGVNIGHTVQFSYKLSPWPGDFAGCESRSPIIGGNFRPGFLKDYWGVEPLDLRPELIIPKLPNGLQKYYMNVRYDGDFYNEYPDVDSFPVLMSFRPRATRLYYGPDEGYTIKDSFSKRWNPCNVGLPLIRQEGIKPVTIRKYLELYGVDFDNQTESCKLATGGL